MRRTEWCVHCKTTHIYDGERYVGDAQRPTPEEKLGNFRERSAADTRLKQAAVRAAVTRENRDMRLALADEAQQRFALKQENDELKRRLEQTENEFKLVTVMAEQLRTQLQIMQVEKDRVAVLCEERSRQLSDIRHLLQSGLKRLT